ncbi:MAG: thiamine-phosphate kinase [Proteobacteria bacterium]|nr:thiamine-phosphate kinase [Pseudomonadota bacterium]
MLSEDSIIRDLQSIFPQYIGDDAAILPCNKAYNYLLSKDLLVEDIHFRTSYYGPADLAHKALHANLSDIAAMGGAPKFVMLGVAIPIIQAEYVKDFLSNFANVCQQNSIILIGGDTTSSPDKLYISITAIGEVHKEYIKYRNNARVGDLVCVAGNLGHAHLGLQALERSIPQLKQFKDALLRPMAKLEEGAWLGRQGVITAIMDVSDGLYIDLSKLCSASGKGAEIEVSNLVASREFKAACSILGLDPITTMLVGGEDYGLLFTVEPNKYSAISADFRNIFGYELQVMGRITCDVGVNIRENGEVKNLELNLFTHFGEKI